MKKDDPYGRIVHDYGFYKKGSYSINAAHSSTSVRYCSMQERAEILANVRWYVKADLASGFRQFGTHPVDWRYQVYCNGNDEHYIDIACPFRKTNSPLEFCPPVALFAASVAKRYQQEFTSPILKLGTYVDDVFGGFLNCPSESRANHIRTYLCFKGKMLTLHFNMEVHKTPLASQQQVILGNL